MESPTVAAPPHRLRCIEGRYERSEAHLKKARTHLGFPSWSRRFRASRAIIAKRFGSVTLGFIYGQSILSELWLSHGQSGTYSSSVGSVPINAPVFTNLRCVEIPHCRVVGYPDRWQFGNDVELPGSTAQAQRGTYRKRDFAGI